MVAINEVTQEVFKGSPDFFPIKPTDYGRFLVLSLGTGSAKAEEKFNARKASKWGVLGWLSADGSTPLIDVFTQASADMVDIHISVVFQALHSQSSYLRIQVNIVFTQACLVLIEKSVVQKLIMTLLLIDQQG